MPMKCKPGGKITVCLECDKEDPVETRTVFLWPRVVDVRIVGNR